METERFSWQRGCTLRQWPRAHGFIVLVQFVCGSSFLLLIKSFLVRQFQARSKFIKSLCFAVSESESSLVLSSFLLYNACTLQIHTYVYNISSYPSNNTQTLRLQTQGISLLIYLLFIQLYARCFLVHARIRLCFCKSGPCQGHIPKNSREVPYKFPKNHTCCLHVWYWLCKSALLLKSSRDTKGWRRSSARHELFKAFKGYSIEPHQDLNDWLMPKFRDESLSKSASTGKKFNEPSQSSSPREL